MFESHFTHHFFRLWGVKEGEAGIQPDALLLGNSQNEFDEQIGDVAGVAGCRFFIIEFKRDRKGIAEEVKEKVKPHRYHLYQHLRNDPDCRRLAFVGHYAAYPDCSNHVAFEPYAHAVAPRATTADVVRKTIFGNESSHELDFSRSPLTFDEFYEGVTETDETMSQLTAGVYRRGLGLPQCAFEEYIRCMYQHLQNVQGSDGDAIAGIVSPKTGKFIAFRGTVEDLVQNLYDAFAKLSRSIKSAPRPSGPSGP